MPVSSGDRLGTTDGRVEVSLGRRNFIRLDADTKVDFLNFPDKRAQITRLKVWAGNVYVSLHSLLSEKAVELHTADASVYFLEKGLVRLDVLENERTEILVFEGTVEIAGSEGSNILGAGQKIEVAGGRFLSRPGRLSAAAGDGFDEWNAERDALVDRKAAGRYLPEEIWEYEPELDAYGDWVHIAPYGHVWVPRGMGAGWRPYYYGRWTWIPFCGWTWVSYDPWGWAPFHYGRWHWDPFYGWYWIPSSLWGPAWVSWWWGWDYYGWAPLSWYGYPGVVINNRYYSRYTGNYPNNSAALTVVRKNQLKAPDISREALRAENFRDVDRIAMSTDLKLAPRPESMRGVAVERIEGGKVLLRSRETPVSEERVIRGRGSRAEEDPGRGSAVRGRDQGALSRGGEKSGPPAGETSPDRSSPRVSERPSRSQPEGGTSRPDTSSKETEERKIKKKEDESEGRAASLSRGSYGYPPSSESGRSRQTERSSSWSSSLSVGRIYDRIVSRGSSSSSSSGSSSRATVSSRSGGSSSASRSGASASSRSSSGPSRSSSSSGSSARRKD